MGLSPGQRVGPYEVVERLGAGGMGEVYRARDLRLHRPVALKILPDAVARDDDRRIRFAREAQTLAALNHPNIAAIYGIEDSGSVHAIAMELVDGEDLSQRIARGAVPLDETLPMMTRFAVCVSSWRTAIAMRSPDGDHAGVTKKQGARISGGFAVVNVRRPEPSALMITSALSLFARA